MNTLKLGSLFTGYGGLDMAITSALPATTTWVSDFDAGPNKILAHRYPNVPNLGDITKIDWHKVEPVDIISGGFPCQDVSMAGRRAGMTAGTRSNLWGAMRTAIEIIRPQFVVAENVRGLLSAKANSDSDMEPGQGFMGDERAGHLRALGRVLGDLADLGYNASWHSVRASDAGAPHQRHRVFIFATNARGGGSRRWPNVTENGSGTGPNPTVDRPNIGLGVPGNIGLKLLPTPTASETGGIGTAGEGGPNLRTLVAEQLLPTPVAQPSGNPPAVHLRKKPGRTRVTDLAMIVENDLIKSGGQLLPTPRASDGPHGGPNQRGSKGDLMLSSAVHRLLPTPVADNSRGNPSPNTDFSSLPNEVVKLLPTPTATDFGPYQPAINRWENIVGRPAPTPTEPNKHHRPRLAPKFVEWIMGLPEGWVTETPGITHTEALRALGNGVVPQQGALALNHLLTNLNEMDQS